MTKTINKRIEITIKTNRLLMIRGHYAAFGTECEKCGERVEMVAPDEASAVAQIDLCTIYRAIKEGEIHFVEMPVLLVCLNSVLNFLNFQLPAGDQKRLPDTHD